MEDIHIELAELKTEARIFYNTQREWNTKMENRVSDHGVRLRVLERKMYIISAAAAILGTIGGSGILKLMGSLLG